MAGSRCSSAARAICRSTSITASRIARSPSARRCAGARRDRRGIGRYGFLLPMDEAEAQVADRSLRAAPYSQFEGEFTREPIGGLADRAGAALLPLARRQRSARRSTSRVDRRERPSQDRGLLQGVGRALRQAVAREGDRSCRARRACCERRPSSICGCGNLGSIALAFERLGARAHGHRRSRSDRRAPQRDPCPGVGAARLCDGAGSTGCGLRDYRRAPHAAGARHLPRHATAVRAHREEGERECLGVIPGTVRAAAARRRAARAAHGLEPARGRATEHAASRSGDYVYFVHSYRLRSRDPRPWPARYGRRFPAAVRQRQLLRRAVPPRALGRARRALPRGLPGVHDPLSRHRPARRTLRAALRRATSSARRAIGRSRRGARPLRGGGRCLGARGRPRRRARGERRPARSARRRSRAMRRAAAAGRRRLAHAATSSRAARRRRGAGGDRQPRRQGARRQSARGIERVRRRAASRSRSTCGSVDGTPMVATRGWRSLGTQPVGSAGALSRRRGTCSSPTSTATAC